MSAKVVFLPMVTKLDLPVERILKMAAEANLHSVIVIGYEEDGETEYFASSAADGPSVLWLMERMKLALLQTCDSEEPE